MPSWFSKVFKTEDDTTKESPKPAPVEDVVDEEEEDEALPEPRRVVNVAYASAPLAAAIFDLGGIGTVLIHGMTVSVSRDGTEFSAWEDVAKRIGEQIRAHLKSGMPVLDPEYQQGIDDEAIIGAKLQKVIDEEINPGIASHSGCHGCAASTITLRSGIEGSFRGAVPELGAVLDETDHTSGTNPFFKELPAEMGM